jgi:hypothetical protein
VGGGGVWDGSVLACKATPSRALLIYSFFSEAELVSLGLQMMVEIVLAQTVKVIDYDDHFKLFL